jgi:hypothetical protein
MNRRIFTERYKKRSKVLIQDRWRYQTERTKELKRPEHTLCDSSPNSGEEEEANAEERTSDDAYFKEAMSEMGRSETRLLRSNYRDRQ